MATPLPAAEASLPPTPSTPDLQPPTNIMPAAQNDLMPPAQQDAMPPPQPDDDDLDPEDEQPTTSAEVAEMHAKLDAEEENDFKDWDTSDGDKLRVQLQAKEDDLAAEVENIRIAHVAYDVRRASSNWSDGENNRQLKEAHIERLLNSFSMNLSRVRGELPIIAMSIEEFDNLIEYTATVFEAPTNDVRSRATNPDQWRKDHNADGVARVITDLQPLLLPPAVRNDPKQLPELQAGHHRFEAMARWGKQRDPKGLHIFVKGEWENPNMRDRLLELFAFGCYIVDKEKLYKNPDLKRYVRANKSETYMPNSEGDTFRYIRKSYTELTPEQRRAIAACKDPLFPLGVPQWVAYITGTVMEKLSNQDRLKRILTHSAFSSLADTYCRFLWGRATFANSMWCELIKAGMPSFISNLLQNSFNTHYAIFKDNVHNVTDDELELVNKCFDWTKIKYNQDMLVRLFLPDENDTPNETIKTPSISDWRNVMPLYRIPEGDHPGRTHRHPLLFPFATNAEYEEIFARIKAHVSGPILSGSLMTFLANNHIPVMADILHFLYYLYEPTNFLPSGQNSDVTRNLDLAARLRPLAYPTEAERNERRGEMDFGSFDPSAAEAQQRELKQMESKWMAHLVYLLWNIKRQAVKWKKGAGPIHAAICIRPKWRGTLTDETRVQIFETIQRETWLHPILEFFFPRIDKEAMVGIGATIRQLDRDNKNFWDPAQFKQALAPIGRDLAAKLKSNTRTSVLPKQSRQKIMDSSAIMIEALVTANEYREAFALIKRHEEFTQGPDYSPAVQQYSKDSGNITSAPQYKQTVLLLRQLSARLAQLGFGELPKRINEFKAASTEDVEALLPFGNVSVARDGFLTLYSRTTQPFLTGYDAPPNLEEADRWVAKQKPTKGEEDEFPLSASRVDPADDNSDPDAAATPSKPARPKNLVLPSGVHTPKRSRPGHYEGEDSENEADAEDLLAPNPKRTKRDTRESTTGSGNDVIPFTPRKKLNDYKFRFLNDEAINTGEVDDDRGNPYLFGNKIDDCNQYLQSIYDGVSRGGKGAFTKLIKDIRARQHTNAVSITGEEDEDQYPTEWLSWKPMTVKDKAAASKGSKAPRARASTKGKKNQALK